VPVDYLSEQSTQASFVQKFLLLPVLAWRLNRYLRRSGSSVVMSHLFRANYVNVLAVLLFRSPHRTILVNHTRPGRLASEGLSGKVNLALFRWLYPRADTVASVSTAAAAECAEMAGYGSEKTAVLYNPVDTSRAAAIAAAAAFTGTAPSTAIGAGVVPAGDRGPFIVAVGRLIGLKRFGDLIGAFSKVAVEYPSLRLRIVGEGPARSSLEDRVRSLGLECRVDFRGRREDPFTEIAGARALVSASETEGFGMTLVEALALGVPVISSDCPYGPREILAPDTDSRTLLPCPGDPSSGIILENAAFGILFPVGSVESLTEALRRLLDDGELARRYAQRGPDRAADFDIQRVAEAYEALLFNSTSTGGSR
jgi:N-acetylgalactosamine-N,N'-diacetylbacillosaminyl-diphospho-undecaprenol 4-alpha-N-acetylgalactosaminyltransferase